VKTQEKMNSQNRSVTQLTNSTHSTLSQSQTTATIFVTPLAKSSEIRISDLSSETSTTPQPQSDTSTTHQVYSDIKRIFQIEELKTRIDSLCFVLFCLLM
jgi:hypothetical protein